MNRESTLGCSPESSVRHTSSVVDGAKEDYKPLCFQIKTPRHFLVDMYFTLTTSSEMAGSF